MAKIDTSFDWCSQISPEMTIRTRAIVWRSTVLSAVMSILFVIYPIAYRSTRIAMLAGIVIAFAGAVTLVWKWKPIRVVLLSTVIVPLILLILPGRQWDVDVLRSEYVKFLRTYEDTRYVWGGESSLGIDCSGLVRKPLIFANLAEGLSTLNGTHLRTAFSLWWHDCSAKAIGDEYRNQTVRLRNEASINSANFTSIQPGDLAVTTDGIHVLAYLGEKEWIQADPNLNRVVRLIAPAENPWFDLEVRIVRWKMLSGAR